MKTYVSIISISLVLVLTGASCSQPTTKTSNDTQPSTTNSKTSLDLSGQNLTKIPEDTFNKKNLETLDVSDNQLEGAIQAEIRQLTKLKTLNASNNQMTGVPAEVGQLKNLETLNLSKNKLTGLPNELGNLQNLKTLNLSGNDYSELDLEIIQDNLPSTTQIITE